MQEWELYTGQDGLWGQQKKRQRKKETQDEEPVSDKCRKICDTRPDALDSGLEQVDKQGSECGPAMASLLQAIFS